MAGRIDYDIEKYQFTEAGETPRLREQWREVYLECRQLRAGAEERLRIALLNVDYVTSFELPFRLLLVRAPQLIADVRETLQLSRKAAVFNGKRYGCVYSLKQDLQAVPEAFHYRLANRIRRVDATGLTAAPYQQIAREIKPARERLRQALNAGLPVTALDALFWFGSQRVAADIAQLRRSGMA
ncbi:TPA: DNA-binding protein, partial [Klebsiella pneumoniae]|nr:DNA-binding protein [Klebsiella pneumoniae]HBV1812070.1 DNA-binding protein [Klebsiella pneumoniae]HBV2325845.1 DNA-binding protein [Klebsiella pneumoniae]HBV2330986.1 DNA-binding protein [Klebsiella pneumoniae]